MKSIPEIYADRLALLDPTEKQKLRDFLSSPLWLKLMRVAACMKPSANCTHAGSRERDHFSNDRANARLGELRGWEMHELALMAAVHEAPEAREVVAESYPDEGRIDHDFTKEVQPKAPAPRRKRQAV